MVHPVTLPPPPAPIIRANPSEASSNFSRLSENAPIMRNGSRGDHVRGLQERLNAAGVNSGPVDGKFGDLTQKAVRNFQRVNGLQVDGVAGPNTLRALLRMPARAGNTPAGDRFEIGSGTRPSTASRSDASAPPPVLSAIEARNGTRGGATDRSRVTLPSVSAPNIRANSNSYRLSENAPIMRRGSRGDHVRGLQERLNAAGINAGPVDGNFGGLTQKAVRDFQRVNGLQVDGVAGPNTLRALVRTPARAGNTPTGDRFEIGSGARPSTASRSGASAPPPVRSAIEARDAAAGGTTGRLHNWYRQPSNYRTVKNSIRGTTNMCANFVTTALEKSGALSIPRSTRYVGFDDTSANSVRMWAPSLARYLENEKGWNRVHNFSAMKPGDVLFTNGREGTYNHVMMLDSWVDQSNGVARVTDNQGFAYTRNLRGGPKSPVSYALRK